MNYGRSEFSAEYLLCVFDAFFCWWIDAFECIGDAERLIFVEPERMVGKDVDALYVMERCQEGTCLKEPGVVVCNPGDQDMAYPDRLIDFIEIVEHVENVFVGLSGQKPVLVWINVLDIQ